MMAQIIRVLNSKVIIAHLPGVGSVIKVHLKDDLEDMPKASCISPLNPVSCVLNLGYYKEGSFHDSIVTIHWVQHKKQRTQYKLKI